MAIRRALIPVEVRVLGDDEVEITMTTDGLARDGHILEPRGCVLTNYRKNPIQLWQHNPEYPVGTNENIVVYDDKITATCRFAPLGISAKADEIRGLVKANVIRTVSVTFDGIDGTPLNPNKPRGGQRFTKWELLECSFVSVPSDTDAAVTARALQAKYGIASRADDAAEWHVGASRSLPVEDSDEWDGAAAAKSIFEWAGGDEFDSKKARRGFLVYNASKADKRGGYKLPIAHVVDGKLKVPRGAIKAAASRLPNTNIPDDVREKAGAVLDHYKEKAGMNTSERRALVDEHKRFLSTDRKPHFRGLYEVANLAYAVENIGYIKSCADWEAAMEEDESAVPAMLGESLIALGKALVAMTQEEVAEMLTDRDVEIVEEENDEGVIVTVEERKKDIKFRAVVFAAALKRAAEADDEETKEKSGDKGDMLKEAQTHHSRAMKRHRAMGESHDNASEQMDATDDSHGEMREAHEKLGEALRGIVNDKGEADEDKVAAAQEHHREMGDALHEASAAHKRAMHHVDEAEDTHGALGRSLRSAMSCVRAAMSSEDTDNKEVQKSTGVEEDEGSRSVDFRRRQAELLALGGRIND